MNSKIPQNKIRADRLTLSSLCEKKKPVGDQEGLKDGFIPGEPVERTADWTVLIYSSLSPDIDRHGMESFREVEKTGSDENVSVAMQLARKCGWGGARRLFFPKKNDGVDKKAETVENLGNVNMASSDVLESFVKWGMKRYPADHYALVLGGHSGGFMGAVTDVDRMNMTPLPEIENALADVEKATGKKADVLAFNSCMMGQVEVAAQFEDRAEVMVASEMPENAAGMPLGGFIKRLKSETAKGQGVTAKRAGEMLVEESEITPQRTPTMASYDMKRVKRLTDSMEKTADAILRDEEAVDAVRRVALKTSPLVQDGITGAPFTSYKNLPEFVRGIMECHDINEGVRKTAGEVLKNVEKVVQASVRKDDAAETPGLSVYAPTEDLHQHGDFVYNTVTERYSNLDFINNRRWVELMRRISASDSI